MPPKKDEPKFDELPFAGDEIEYAKKRMWYDQFRKTLGSVTATEKLTGIHRNNYYLWREVDDEFRVACDEIRDIAIDYVEGKLMKHIKQDNLTAIIFYLKTQGKSRGYVETIENKHVGQPPAFSVEIANNAPNETDKT